MRKVVIDTNCLLMCVSANSPYHKVWSDFIEGKVAWCVSTEILAEYNEILALHTSPWFAEVVVNTIVNNETTIRVAPTFFFHLIQADLSRWRRIVALGRIVWRLMASMRGLPGLFRQERARSV